MSRSATAKASPCGDRLVRLRDVSLETRLSAFQKLLRQGQVKGTKEAAKLWELVYDPQDKGGRIAA